MKIVVPSYKRAGDVITRALCPSSIIACHAFEAEEYADKEGGELMILPDALRGNIAKVRNYILDNAEDDYIVMMDDDIREVGHHELNKKHPLSSARYMVFLEDGYRIAEELKVHLWGINVQADPIFYHEYNPITFHTPVLGSLSCHLRQTKRYDEDLFLNEDYDLFLKLVLADRKVLRFDKYYYLAGHINQQGGCASYRRLDEERRQADVMVRRWGAVVRYNFKKSTNPTINIPL